MNIKVKVKESVSIYSELPRSIYILTVCRIINAMGNFVYPFLTFFLTERLGFSAKQAGRYFMFSTAMQMIGSLIAGRITDKVGRKKLMLLFQGIAGLCFIPCAFLGNSILIPVFLILSGFFNGASQPVNSAMITDLTNKDNRKGAFSLLYLGINIGFAIGPMLAGFMYRNHTNWIFLGNAISIFISVFLIMFFIKETAPSGEDIENSRESNDDEAAEDRNVFIAFYKRPTLCFFLIGKTINQFVYASIGFVIPLYMSSIFGKDLGPKYFGTVMSFTGVVIIACTTLIIAMTRKIKPIINVSLAAVFYAVGLGMLGIVNKLGFFYVSAFLFTIGEILEATNSGIYVANHSPITHRGRFNAIIPLVTGMGSMFAPTIYGAVIDGYNIKTVWAICFVLAIISSLFLRWLRGFEIRHKSKGKRAMSV